MTVHDLEKVLQIQVESEVRGLWQRCSFTAAVVVTLDAVSIVEIVMGVAEGSKGHGDALVCTENAIFSMPMVISIRE